MSFFISVPGGSGEQFHIDTTDQANYLSQGALKAFSTGTSIIGFTLLSHLKDVSQYTFAP